MTNIARFEKNEKLNGIEIYFAVYPLVGTRDTLKKYGYRWNHKKACWYAKDNADTQNIANIICETTLDEYREIADREGVEVKEIKAQTERKADKPKVQSNEKKNKFGVKVGDIFHMSWGYEQTNNNWFKVVALAGEQSVRVVEVVPQFLKESAISPMSADYTYNVRECVAKESSMWIKDQAKGDIKRLKSFRKDGTCPQFNVTSYADAYLVQEDVVTVYDSWGY